MLNHNLKHALKNHTFIDLFAGIGGFHLALSSFGAKCVFASEWDKDAQKVYEYNFKIQPHGDITQINENIIPKHDILCAGFPCQAFSISGKQKGFEDSRGTLFFDVVRIAKKHQPKILLLENVKNFETHDKGNTLKVVLKTLSEIGYTVHYKVLNVSDFEIPQKRERIYLVAIRNDLKTEYTFPTGTKKTVLLEDFLGDSDDKIEKVTINNKIIWNGKNLNDFTPNKTNRLGIYNKGGQGERVYNPKGHAITLSASGGGIGAKTGMYKIGNVVRRLTPKECARISGFPDSYTIASTPNVAYKQFGNTVVTNMIQSIVVEITKQGNIMTTLQEIGSQTAKAGFQNERDVAQAFLNWKTNTTTQEWLSIMGYNIEQIDWIKAEVISGHKADVVVEIKIKLKEASTSENIQVKLITGGNFNQIDKRKADKYASMWNIPKDILSILKRFSGELPPTCQNPKDERRMFIYEFTDNEQSKLFQWLNKNKVLILTDILKGRGQFASEWYLVIKKNDVTMTDWILQPINKVLNHFAQGDIVQSPKGSININGITLQRKGGTPDPESLQFKIKPYDLKNI